MTNEEFQKEYEKAKVILEARTLTPEFQEKKKKYRIRTNKYHTISCNELSKMEANPFPWIANNIIPENALTIIAGRTGCGKSLIAFYFADRISQGKDICNNPELSTKKSNILIVDQEMNEDDHIDRVHKIIQDTNNVFIIYEQNFKLDKTENVKEILDLCKALDIKVIIFDTLSKIHFGDENSNTDMTQIMDKLVSLCRENQLTIICIHHYNKNKEANEYDRSRGASSIVDNCASFLEVQSKKIVNEFGYDALSISINQHKNRRNISINEFGIEVINMPDDKLLFEYKDKMTGANEIVQKYMDLVLGYITQNPGLSKTTVIETLKIDYNNDKAMTRTILRDCIDSLLLRKQIYQDEGKTHGRRHLYPKNDTEKQEILLI